jgi:hypothetical protein
MAKKTRSIRRHRQSLRRSHPRSTRRGRSIVFRHRSHRGSNHQPQSSIHPVSSLQSIPIELRHVEPLNPRILPTYSSVSNQVRRNKRILTVPHRVSIHPVNRQ